MSETATKVGLYSALAKAQGDTAAVAHDAKNDHHNFNYTSAEAMIGACRASLSKHGLSFVRVRADAAVVDGAVIARSKFVLGHSSGETLELESELPAIEGKGRPIDKAILGAQTSILGYALRDLLLVPRGLGEQEVSARDDQAHEPKPPVGNRPALNAALDKGKANRDDEATGNFIAALESIGWDIEAFSAELVKFAGIKVPAKIAKPFSAWDEWIKVKARELFAAIDADQREKESTPAKTEPAAVAGIPNDDIPF